MKLIGALLLTSLWTQWALAIQVPEQCLEQKKTPCLVKLEAATQLKSSFFNIDSVQETLLRIVQFDPEIKAEVIKGDFKIQSGYLMYIDGYKTESRSWSYIRKEGLDYKLLNSEEIDLLSFGLDYKNKSTQYVLIKKEFLDKKLFFDFVHSFYSSNADFKKDFEHLSEKYKNKLEQDTELQTRKLQEKMDRQIASVKAAEELKEKRRAEIELDRKKTRQMFFMRTFEQ